MGVVDPSVENGDGNVFASELVGMVDWDWGW
jgi:hypothetical protein